MQTNKKTNKNFVRKNNDPKKVNVKKTVKAPKVEDNITVIVIDDQNDFGNPDGALYVTGGENINKPILYFIKNNKKVNQVILTRDWHPKKHMSFKTNGGEWPNHCVQGTTGAEIVDELKQGLIDMRIPFVTVDKGCTVDHEEYGAFEHCATFHHLHPNDDPSIKNCYFANHESSSGCRIINNNLVICGIAGDYCVKETMKNLMGHWKKFNISVLMDGVVSIDGGTALNEFIEANNLKKI